jgi:hypothetical protein
MEGCRQLLGGCRRFRPYMGQPQRLHPRQKPISSSTAVVERPINLLTNIDIEREDHLRLLDPGSTMLLRNVGECLPERGVTSQKICTVTDTAWIT